MVREETTACCSLPLAGKSPLYQPAAGPGGAAGTQGLRRHDKADGVAVTGVLGVSLQEAAGKEQAGGGSCGWTAPWGRLSQSPGPEGAGRALGRPPSRACPSLGRGRPQCAGQRPGPWRLTLCLVRGRPGFLPTPVGQAPGSVHSRVLPRERPGCPGLPGSRHTGLWTLSGDT